MVRFGPILVFFVLLLAWPQCSANAKSWLNISPLKTTRADVFRLLGAPKQSESNGEYFEIDSGVVVFQWIRPTCRITTSCMNGLSLNPTDLVLRINFQPTKPLESDVLPKRESKSMKDWLSEDIDCLGSDESGVWNCIISDTADGFGYTTAGDKVTTLFFFPTAQEVIEWNRTHDN